MSGVCNPTNPDPRADRLRASLIGLAVIFSLMMAVPRAEACTVRVVRSPETVRIDYDPFVQARPLGRLDLELANDGDITCALKLRITTQLGEPLRVLDLGGVGVAFQAHEGTSLVSRNAEPNVFDAELLAGQTLVVRIDAMVATEAVPEAGAYSADLSLAVEDAEGTALAPKIPVTILLQSPPRAQVSIAGAAGAFGSSQSVEVLDMGDASTGLSKRAFLQIRANTDARLSIQSENAGVLRRPGDVSEESTIAYVLTLDGEPLNLRHLVVRDVDPPRDLKGQSIPFDITLGAVGSQMAGRYQDVLTIDIDPR